MAEPFRKKVDGLEVETWAPWPWWITIKFEDREIRISHRELPDLRYMLERLALHITRNDPNDA